jgi:hypothetical protein
MEAKKTLAVHAKDLREEAERVAGRSKATHVSPTYVADAATHLRLGQKSSKWAEGMTAVGATAIGLAGGALINAEQAPGDLVLDTSMWIYLFSGASGLVLASLGYMLKIRR